MATTVPSPSAPPPAYNQASHPPANTGTSSPTFKRVLVELVAIGCCMGGGSLVASLAFRGISPLAGALIGGSGGVIGSVAKAACDRLFGSSPQVQTNVEQASQNRVQSGANSVKTVKMVENTIVTSTAVIALEGGLSSLLTYPYSPISGAILGVTSAIIDTIVNVVFNLLHLENKLIKQACKISLTALSVMATLSVFGLPEFSLLGIVAIKLGVKQLLMPLIMEIFDIQITEPKHLLQANTLGTRNLLENNTFELGNFMWPAKDFS